MHRLLSALVLVICSSPMATAAEPSLTAGFAERDITPDIGMERPGGYGKAFHRSFHDPCNVHAAVFSDGKTEAALVSVDALIVRRDLVLAARERIEKQCGIPGAAVMIHATHSHSSGPTGMIAQGDFDESSELVQELAYEKSSNADPKYVKHVEDQIVDAVCAAHQSRQPVQCSAGSGQATGIAFNRRFHMRDGYTFTHPRPGNPGIIEPAGPTDPEVGVIGAWDANGKLVGCLVNYVCHATTSPGGISANYIHYLKQVIQGVFGEDVVVVFLAGASGDVTQVDNLTRYQNPRPEDWARLVGGTIGAEAVKVLLKAVPGDLTPVAVKSKTWEIARRRPSKEHVQQALELVKQSPEAVGATEWTFAKETVLIDDLARRQPQVEVEVQAIQIGPAVFLSDPAEYFCQFGLDIKQGSPFPLTFPVSLANGCVGYVPTEEAFGPRGGGYETRLTSYSNLEITAGRQMADAAIELAKSLTPGTVPHRPPVAEFNDNPWTYGAVPPQLD